MVGVVGAISAAAARWNAMSAADGAWQSYAAERGLRHAPMRMGWAHSQMPRVDGVIDDVPVAIELDDSLHTAVLSAPALPLRGNLHVTREGLFARASKLLGAQDIVVGDEAFDPLFLVKASDPEVARTLLGPRVRDEMVLLGAASLAYDDGSQERHVSMVVLVLPRVATSAAELDRALRVVVELARVRGSDAPYR